MKTISAYGAAIAPYHIRGALFGLVDDPKSIVAVMHPAQLAAIVELYECTALTGVLSDDLETIEAVKRLAHHYRPETIMDIPIVLDELSAPDRIQFFPKTGGKPIAVITQLGIPVGFQTTP